MRTPHRLNERPDRLLQLAAGHPALPDPLTGMPERRRLRFPHPLILLVACALLAAALTHLLPAGQFERREDAATGRSVVVAPEVSGAMHSG